MTKKPLYFLLGLALLCLSGCGEKGTDSGALGLEAYRNGDYRKAEAYFAQAVTQNQSDGSAYISLGMSRIALGRYDEASGDFQTAIEKGADRFYALRGMGIAALEKGDWAKACDCFTEALTLKEAKEKGLNQDITAYLAEAQAGLGDNEKALELYGGLAQAGYHAADICLLMGDICAREGDTASAFAYYQKSLDIDSGSYDSFLHMAESLEEAGDEEGRQAVLEAALQIQAKTPQSMMNRGRCLLALDREQEAFAAFEEAYNGGSLEAGLYLGYCYEQRDNRDEAIRLYQEIIRKNPDMAGVYNSLGRCYTEAGQYENALTMLEKGITLSAENGDRSTRRELMFNRGICLERQGNREEALAAFLELTEEFPDDGRGERELVFLRSRK